LKKLNTNFLKLDLQSTLKEIIIFIKTTIENTKASGVVVGLSGGVDSTLTATLCTKALGKEKVLGVIMPLSFTPKEDTDDAFELAKILGIKVEFINISDICRITFNSLGLKSEKKPIAKTRLSLANLRARVRMVILYFFANSRNLLVAGTGDRSENLIGYFTKYGDGAADFFPIIHLYKTQVRELTKYLGIPDNFALKPSNPRLYPRHKISDEIPLYYDKLDLVFKGLFDLEFSPKKVSRMFNVPEKKVIEVVNRHNLTQHKRILPPKLNPFLSNDIT
jgi:NAD+ synthase